MVRARLRGDAKVEAKHDTVSCFSLPEDASEAGTGVLRTERADSPLPDRVTSGWVSGESSALAVWLMCLLLCRRLPSRRACPWPL